LKTKLLILFLFTTIVVLAQTTTSNSFWFGYYPSLKLTNRLKLNGDFQLRTRKKLNEINTQLNRIGLCYSLKNKTEITLGGAYFNTFKLNKLQVTELRLWQEFSLKSKFKHFKINYRLRTEQRWFKPIEQDMYSNSSLAIRIRNKLEIVYRPNENSKIEYFIANEIMFHRAKTNYNLFDQNRASLGAYLKITNNLTLSPQFIFLNQLQNNNKQVYLSVYRINLIHTIN
jgi:hypothetical protein